MLQPPLESGRWKNQGGGNADDQLAKQIAEILAEKTRDMYEACCGQGIDEERLGGCYY